MSLWNPVYSVLLCYSVRNRTHPLYKMRRMLYVGEFFLSWKIFFFLTEGISFSHRTHRFNRPHLRTVSSTQNAFGIQISQNVTANENTNKEEKSSLYPAHRGISVITPLPFGGGEGGGAIIFLNPVCSVLLCSSVRNRTHPRYEITHKQLAGEVFLSQSAQSSLSLLAHSLSPQNAFGIQRSQRPSN